MLPFLGIFRPGGIKASRTAFRDVVSCHNCCTLDLPSLAVVLSCPCMVQRGSLKYHLSYLGSWNMRFLVSKWSFRHTLKTPSVLLNVFYSPIWFLRQVWPLVACRIQNTQSTSWSSAVFCLVFCMQSFFCSFDCFHREVFLECLEEKSSWFHCAFVRGFFPPYNIILSFSASLAFVHWFSKPLQWKCWIFCVSYTSVGLGCCSRGGQCFSQRFLWGPR